MHDESGLKHEEIQPFWHDVFASIKRTHPKFRLDLRAKGLPDAVINDAVDLGLNAKISTKYWMEQMGLPFHPTHINIRGPAQPPSRLRRSAALSADLPRALAVVERRHYAPAALGRSGIRAPLRIRRVHLYDGDSFEVNEMLATKMLGEPQDEKPLEILNPAYRYLRLRVRALLAVLSPLGPTDLQS